MPQLIALRKGGVKCSSACPFYTETGKVSGVRGVPLKTHCRMTMNPWMADCDVYNTKHIEKMEVSESEWEMMQKSIGKKATKQIKLYPEEHEEIHPIGYHWSHDKWRATKSSDVKTLKR